VNTFLILAALMLSRRAALSIIVLPSIAALLHGVLFGPATPFLLFFLPVIWIANAVFVFSLSSLDRSMPQFAALGIAAVAKSFLLFLIASLAFRFALVPALFVTSMGVMQLITAVLGGLLAFIIRPTLK
jgi:hypothetical protein